jgi:hypothetical protein
MPDGPRTRNTPPRARAVAGGSRYQQPGRGLDGWSGARREQKRRKAQAERLAAKRRQAANRRARRAAAHKATVGGYLTLDQAAQALGVPPSNLTRWARTGMPHRRLRDGRVLFATKVIAGMAKRLGKTQLVNPVCGLAGEEFGEAERAKTGLLAQVDGQGVAEQLALPARPQMPGIPRPHPPEVVAAG